MAARVARQRTQLGLRAVRSYVAKRFLSMLSSEGRLKRPVEKIKSNRQISKQKNRFF